jgi:hypothetical protein
VRNSQLNNPRFVVGMILVAVAVLMVLFLGDDYAVGAAGIGIMGLLSIATARRK